MKKDKRSKDSGNGAVHTYAGHVVNVEVAAESFFTLSKKKGESRRFVLAGPSDAQLAMIGLASSAMALGKKLHIEFANGTAAEAKVTSMRLGTKLEPAEGKEKTQPASEATAPAA